MPSWGSGGNQTAGSGLGGGNIGGKGGRVGGPPSGGRGGNNVGPGAGVAPFSRTKVRKTPTRPVTSHNLVTAIGGTILGGMLPGVGIGVGPMAMDAMGLGYEGPVGTAERLESDPPDHALQVSGTGNTQAAIPAALRKRKTTKPTNPLGSIGTILGSAGGELRGGGL